MFSSSAYQNTGAATIDYGPKDPNFTKVVLLTKTLGLNGGQNNTFIDSGPTGNVITKAGNVTQGSFNPFLPSTGFGVNFPSSSFISFPNTSSKFDLGLTDFTIEFKLLFTSAGAVCGTYQWSTGAKGGWEVFAAANGSITMAQAGFTGATSATGLFTAGVWTDIAITRTGTTFKFFKDGVLFSTTSATVNLVGPTGPYPNVIRIGAHLTDGSAIESPINATISNLRISNTIRYLSSYTPVLFDSTGVDGNTLLLTCCTSSFFDYVTSFTIDSTYIRGTPTATSCTYTNIASLYLSSIYGGSAYFDGTGDRLTMANGITDLKMGNGDFTIEFWVYPLVLNNNNYIFTGQGDGASVPGSSFAIMVCGPSGTGTSDFYAGGTGVFSTTAGKPSLNTWSHLAYVRIGGRLSAYMNGVLLSERTDMAANSVNVGYTNYPAQIGSGGNFLSPFNGYISGLRIVKGTGLYSAPFNKPTKAPTAITGTSFLLNFTNADIYDASGINDFETVSNAQITTSVVKYEPGSMKFNGTSDYLKAPNNANLSLITGDFTIEGWIYVNALSTSNMNIVNKDGILNTSYPQYDLSVSSAGKLTAFLGNGTGLSPVGTTYTGTTTISTGAWHHVALVKSGTYCIGFLDGNQEWKVAAATMYEGNKPLYIGYATGGPASYYFNGEIEGVRITKGLARYTANFTAPITFSPPY